MCVVTITEWSDTVITGTISGMNEHFSYWNDDSWKMGGDKMEYRNTKVKIGDVPNPKLCELLVDKMAINKKYWDTVDFNVVYGFVIDSSGYLHAVISHDQYAEYKLNDVSVWELLGDEEGWIENCGEMLCPGDMLVELKVVNVDYELAGTAAACNWSLKKGCITHWRPAREERNEEQKDIAATSVAPKSKTVQMIVDKATERLTKEIAALKVELERAWKCNAENIERHVKEQNNNIKLHQELTQSQAYVAALKAENESLKAKMKEYFDVAFENGNKIIHYEAVIANLKAEIEELKVGRVKDGCHNILKTHRF